MSVLRSMTGFATVEGGLGSGARFVLTIKGVNHRFLDVHFRLPHGCDGLEVELRTRLKERIGRGHVDVVLEVIGAAGTGAMKVDAQVFRGVVEELRSAARAAGVSEEIDAATVLRVPGVLLTEGRGVRVGTEELETGVMAAAAQAIEAFQASRSKEGAELGRELRTSMDRMSSLVRHIQEIRSGVQPALVERFRERMADLLQGTVVSEERLLVEAALLAEKSDVAEEMVRLQAHIERFGELLGRGGAVGKQMDFLLQEFNREANTTLSKSGSAAGVDGVELVGLGLEMKAEIERAREQVQNLE